MRIFSRDFAFTRRLTVLKNPFVLAKSFKELNVREESRWRKPAWKPQRWASSWYWPDKNIDAVRYVNAIFYVDSLEEFSNWLNSKGVETIHKPRVVTSGRNLTARHADGLVVEYFESANPEGN
jgi:hypothetical protein